MARLGIYRARLGFEQVTASSEMIIVAGETLALAVAEVIIRSSNRLVGPHPVGLMEVALL